MIFNKTASTSPCVKNNYFNNAARKLISTCKRIKLDSYLTIYIKVDSKWIKDSNGKCEVIKILEINGESIITFIINLLDTT